MSKIPESKILSNLSNVKSNYYAPNNTMIVCGDCNNCKIIISETTINYAMLCIHKMNERFVRSRLVIIDIEHFGTDDRKNSHDTDDHYINGINSIHYIGRSTVMISNDKYVCGYDYISKAFTEIYESDNKITHINVSESGKYICIFTEKNLFVHDGSTITKMPRPENAFITNDGILISIGKNIDDWTLINMINLITKKSEKLPIYLYANVVINDKYGKIIILYKSIKVIKHYNQCHVYNMDFELEYSLDNVTAFDEENMITSDYLYENFTCINIGDDNWDKNKIEFKLKHYSTVASYMHIYKKFIFIVNDESTIIYSINKKKYTGAIRIFMKNINIVNDKFIIIRNKENYLSRFDYTLLIGDEQKLALLCGSLYHTTKCSVNNFICDGLFDRHLLPLIFDFIPKAFN